MSNTDNGGPAFPLLGDGPNAPCFNEGMTLRDWFAGQALAEQSWHWPGCGVKEEVPGGLSTDDADGADGQVPNA